MSTTSEFVEPHSKVTPMERGNEQVIAYPEWLDRLEDEHGGLCEKCSALKSFLSTHSAPGDISCAQEILLNKQLEVMEEYKRIVYVRLCLANAELAIDREIESGNAAELAK